MANGDKSDPGPGIDEHGQPRSGALAITYAWVVAGPLAYLIPIAWIALALWGTYHLLSISDSQAALGDLTAPNAPAIAAEHLDARLFGVPAISRVAVVQHDAAGLSLSVLQATAVRPAMAAESHSPASGFAAPQGLVGALPIVDQPGIVPSSRQSRTTAITYLVFDPSLDWNVQVAGARTYAAALARTPGSSVVGVGGVIPARLQQGNAILNRLGLVELATLVLIALIVGLTFRSLGAPLVTLAAGVLSYLIAVRVVAWFGQRTGIAAPQELQPLMIVLLLGIVTDYSIFSAVGLSPTARRGAASRRRGPGHHRRVSAHNRGRRRAGRRRHGLLDGRLTELLWRLRAGHGSDRADRPGRRRHARTGVPAHASDGGVLAAPRGR